MKCLRKAARCAALVVTCVSIGASAVSESAMAQAPWTANPARVAQVDPPRTLNDQGIPPQNGAPYSTARYIQFEVPIKRGVHERFNVEFAGVMGLHEFPAGTADHFAAFFAAHPEADFAYRFEPIALINDCDGDGIPSLGAGNPPCWGATSGSVASTTQGVNFPADLRSTTPHGTCHPRPTFRATVSAPPLLNGGIVGIRVRGVNKGLFLGVSVANFWNFDWFAPWGHAWVQFSQERANPPYRQAYGKYPNPTRMRAPGVIKDDTSLMPEFTIWYPVTTAEWQRARTFVIGHLPPYPCSWFHYCDSNCVLFAQHVMEAVGCSLPSSVGASGCFSPKALKEALRDLMQSGAPYSCCAYVVEGLYSGAGPEGRSIDPDRIFFLLAEAPTELAARLEVPVIDENLGSSHLRVGGRLQLDLDFDSDTAVIVDFGDGVVRRGVVGANERIYSAPGSYEGRVVTLVNTELRIYEFTVVVGKGGGKFVSESIAVPSAPPSDGSGERPQLEYPLSAETFPADANRDWIVNGEDLALVLANWGSEVPTMADVDGNGTVDGNDLAIVLAGWGRSEP